MAANPRLDRLAAAHARTALHLSISVSKTPLSEAIGQGTETRCLLYVVGEKLADAVDGAGLELSRLLVPNRETSLVILIGNTSGKAEGPTIRILGDYRHSSLSE